MRCTIADAFVDTNVLLYSVARHAEELRKRDIAKELLSRKRSLAISCQVLQEFYVQATRKGGLEIPHEDAAAILETFRNFEIVPITPAIVFASVGLRRRHAISYWDAAILVAARQAGASLVLSEDLAHGRDYEGVVVENPFHGL